VPAKFEPKDKPSGLKPGDKFEITDFKTEKYGSSFTITSPETGQPLLCLKKECAHLGNLNLILE